MQLLLDALKFKFSHTSLKILVAGTNGKGTFCARLEQVFRDCGLRTGLYTSPHLVSPMERIRLNGIPISDSKMFAFLDQAETAAEAALPDATYFELVTAAAFLSFQEFQTQVDIIEVGLGGRLDSTNVIPADATVLTSVGLDHCDLLGGTLDAIGYEKAYASRRNKPLYCVESNPVALMGVQRAVFVTGAHLVVTTDPVAEVALLAEGKGVAKISPEQISKSVAHYFWPGRMDLRKITFRGQTRDLLFDAAHNGHGVRFFLKQFELFKNSAQNNFSNRTVWIVFGTLKDKDWEVSLDLLSPLAQNFVFTQCRDNPRKVSSTEIQSHFNKRYGTQKSATNQINTWSFENCELALAKAFCDSHPTNDLIVVIGSIALLGECMEVLSTPVFKEGTL